MVSPRRYLRPLLAAGTPLAFLVAGGLPALAQGYAKDSSLPGFDSLIALLGYDNLQGDQRDLLAFVLILFGLGFGYFSHLGFRGAGLGVMLNGLCGLVGSCLALYLLGPKYGLLSQVQGRTHDFLLAVLVGGAAVPALILAIMLANLRSRATVNFFYWRSQRKLNVQRAALIEPELPPRIANLLKK